MTTRTGKRHVYRFGAQTDGRAELKDLLGGKGANLAEMAAAGLPVPPGFTITTEVCKDVADHAGGAVTKVPDWLWPEIDEALAEVEAQMGAKLGDPQAPLLVSVRSGAAVSMPGMMDTVLNLGMNAEVANGLGKKTGKPRFAWDAYRRFLAMFGNVVLELPRDELEHALDTVKHARGAKTDQDLDEAALREVVARYEDVYRAHGLKVPRHPREQLEQAILAVFRSWNSDRAVKYREVQKIRGLIGTAVNVQAMVFGNTGPRSGTGVLFTRSPSTGEPALYGEYLVDAQGEDVVAGVRTPSPIAKLKDEMPEVYAELHRLVGELERHFKNVQDVEFTVQDGRLFLLQTRHGKRTGAAAIRIAVDLVEEGLVTPEEAVVNLVEPAHVDQLLHPHFADEAGYRKAGRVIAKGLAASPGAAVGRVVFDADTAQEWRERGERVILARMETSPEDVAGMHAAEGLLTTRGGMTSHAAVVARGWGKPCIAGCGELVVDYRSKTMRKGATTIAEGDWISLNGTTGEVILGKETLAEAVVSGRLETFMHWVDKNRKLHVRANADTPKDAAKARELGAEGIGLVRTEHMFFEEGRIFSMRKMILAESVDGRRAALSELLPHQRGDFEGIFRAMAGLPVTIRLLDPPLHEFLPEDPQQQAALGRAMGVTAERVHQRVLSLAESNPMLGHRGCRLGITHPEITEMQARAIFEAACNVAKEGVDVRPEIMVPLVGHATELEHQKAIVVRVAREVFAERGAKVDYLVGTMIEVPRAALRAGDLARSAEFFSFGTNDLSQLTLGFSRDDIASFVPQYLAQGVLTDDPFQSIDTEGVGELVRLASERGRAARPDLHLGICGEHGGDPRSIAFFAEVGLDYVSCSPFRVPVARLAAAQAALKGKVKGKAGEA
ncbi:MAG: pyruvate, phosphate dikinase [Sandaracinaceae bacterium]|nr:pyruvate, phosphate dikinase [Sandaracinaceae bacterium]